MGKVLVVGKPAPERDCLLLFLEFSGHRCSSADSPAEAMSQIKPGAFDLILADSTAETGSTEQLVHQLKSAARGVAVIVLTEDVPLAQNDEAITHADSPVRRLSTDFSGLERNVAFLALLPEQENLLSISALPQNAAMLNKIAVLYHAQRKFRVAERLYKRALQLSQKKLRRHPAAEATVLNNLARLYHDQDRLQDAEPLYKRSLAIVEKVFGPNSLKVSTRLRNLADLYRALGRYDQASPLYRRMAAIQEAES